jgi:hypothetical protein
VQAFHVLWFSGEAKALEPYGDTRVNPLRLPGGQVVACSNPVSS